MTISAHVLEGTIVTVSVYKDGIYLVLKPRQCLLITHSMRLPLVGQRITGDKGHVVIEGGDGERIVYARQGSFLREQSHDETPSTSTAAHDGN